MDIKLNALNNINSAYIYFVIVNDNNRAINNISIIINIFLSLFFNFWNNKNIDDINNANMKIINIYENVYCEYWLNSDNILEFDNINRLNIVMIVPIIFIGFTVGKNIL